MDMAFDERPSDSALVERVWHSYSEKAVHFSSMAANTFEMVVTRHQGKSILTVRGSETKATPAIGLDNAEYFGIAFKAGVFMPIFPANKLIDRQDVNLPEASHNSVWLNSDSWEIPDYENAEDFVKKLLQEGLLVYDPLVDFALQGQPLGLSLRTIQRRVLQATGLSMTAIYQIKRARYATTLLRQGVSILDTIERAGYFDQAHMSKALKHLMGQTPAQLSFEKPSIPLSFLYKLEPV
jgi:AraC-like DNA-binding protein